MCSFHLAHSCISTQFCTYFVPTMCFSLTHCIAKCIFNASRTTKPALGVVHLLMLTKLFCEGLPSIILLCYLWHFVDWAWNVILDQVRTDGHDLPMIIHLWDVEKIPSDHSEYVRSPIYSCNEFKCNLERSCRMNTNSMNTIGEQYELEIKSLHNLGELVLCWRELLFIYQCLSFFQSAVAIN